MTTFVYNRHIFSVEPKHVGNSTVDIILNESDFHPEVITRNRKKLKPTSYLLVGFDTEYKSRDTVTPDEIEAGAKNKLLSYQFCVQKIDETQKDDGRVEAEGIVIPEDGKRLRLADFIAIAAGSLIKEHPGTKLPRDILLVGHFTRADFPAFDDFQDAAKEHTANIRNTFVTFQKSHPIIVRERPPSADEPVGQGLDVIGTFNVVLRDTILHAPAGAKALADVGAMIGEPKIVLHPDPKEEQRIKENMDVFMRDHWPEFRRYAIQDARVCVAYAELIIRQSQSMFSEFKVPMTLTSFGTKQVLKTWAEMGWSRNAIIGAEDKTTKAISKCRRYYITSKTNDFIDEVDDEESFVTKCYHGGRNEQYVFGPAKVSHYRDMDLSSAYTTAMSLICFPDWTGMQHMNSLDGIKATDLAFCWVAFEFPRSVRFPTLPIHTNNGLIFPRKGVTHCCAPEIVLALSLGAKLTLKRGLYIPVDAEQRVFQPFISQCIMERKKHPKGSFGNLFWKEVGNSTYGKTAQGLKKRRVYDLRTDGMTDLPRSKITQPCFAAFITSFTRAVLGEIINALPEHVTVFSATTDGFLSDASPVEIATAIEQPLTKIFREARKALVGNDEALEEKHDVRQPLGWRTRGSATLQAGDGEHPVVLQKGGIRTSSPRVIELENEEIVELFITRTPETKIRHASAVGIKDLMRYGTDHVYRDVEKLLGMEFDWKRWPVGPQDIDFQFKGVDHRHLGFETKPLEDVEEFERVREAWERYNKGQRRNLKTIIDFDRFQVFLEAGKLEDKARAYVSRDQGDLKRVRRDLLRAYRSGDAGFDRVKSRTGKFKHTRMASILTTHGIPCTVTNIDNERGKSFVPHQTMRTPRVEGILRSLQRDEFPEIDVELFLAAG